MTDVATSNSGFLQGLSDQRRKDLQEGPAAKPVKTRARRSRTQADTTATHPAGGARTALAQDENPNPKRDEVDRTTDAQLDQQKEQKEDLKDS